MLTIKQGVAGHNKALYGVAIDVKFENGETVESEYRKIRELLLEVKKTKQVPCGAVEIDYYVEDSLRDEIRKFWDGLIENSTELRPLFAGVKVTIGTMSLDGRNYAARELCF
jgi:hypothetical protein